jgi:hypothetical protein
VLKQLKPGGRPLVVYLASNACETSGLFRKSAVAGWAKCVGSAASVLVFDPRVGWPEDVAASLRADPTFEGAAHQDFNIEAMKEMMASEVRRYGARCDGGDGQQVAAFVLRV